MNLNSIIDYWACILIRIVGAVIRMLPVRVSLFLGKRLGDLFYFVDFKHKGIAYANIKTAFSGQFSPRELCKITRNFYRSFGQNLMEILLIPLADKAYVDKHIVVHNKERIFEGFKKGKGVILVAVHAGSWELSNVVCANLGFSFNFFVRDQKYPRLEKLLNSYRSRRGCKLIEREGGTRQLLRALKNNEAIGMTADQGGKTGTTVKFFGKYASMSSGAVRLALKYDAAIVPAFYARVKGPYFNTFIEPPFELKRTGDEESDVRENLQRLVHIFEKYISRYPQEYLWTYKVWKYAKEQDILILSDGKTGHLRQSQALAEIVKECLKDRGITANINIIEVKFKNKFSRFAQTFSSIFARRYICQGCMWCLKLFLEEDVYKSLINIKPDIVISAGASVAPLNYVISQENLSKSITIMRPSLLNTKRFNLTVISRHDRPAKRKNVVAIEGALNLINDDYLKKQGDLLRARVRSNKGLTVGVLIGGDSKDFCLGRDLMQAVNRQVKECLEKLGAEILITTSRRTSAETEALLKEEFSGYGRTGLLVIANEKNIPEAVGGILALSDIIIISPESISMISEAVNSKKYVFVFDAPGLSKKHRRFLDYFSKKEYIYLTAPDALADKIVEVWAKKPQAHALKDNLLVTEAVKKIL